VLMLDTRFIRVPGDVGNAQTWPFPVHYEVVEGADTSRIMGTDPDPSLLRPFLDAARRLERAGVQMITTSCGFLAVFQRELASAVSVPVLTSALLQVPTASREIGAHRKVAILTERPNLTERHFAGAGWSSEEIGVIVRAMPEDAVFPRVFIDQTVEADGDVLERELLDVADRLLLDHPEVGAIVLECTNFVPFSQAIRRRTGLPVFDLYSLVLQAHAAATGVIFPTRSR
jgi:aspartate/glutamate racemase